MAPEVLVVEDEPDIQALIVHHLTREGFRCRTAADGAEALARLRSGVPDLIVLDLMLPGIDGLELTRRLRAEPAWAGLPIIMLTAKADEVDRIVGLEMGADDYVPKPFEPRELVARIRNVLRRTGAAPLPLEATGSGRATFGGWTFDLEKRHLVDSAGRVVSLSGAEYRLLRAFVAEPNRVLTREYLVARSSGRPYSSQQRAIDLQISRLRHKLGDDLAEASLIKTVRNEGYVLAATVTMS